MASDKDKTLEDRVVAFAEQLGRLVGTVESRAEGWLDQKALSSQLTKIRDGAVELLDQVGGAIASGRAAAGPKKTQEKSQPAASAGRSGDLVDAPGKTHRKRAQSTHGAKHSDETISKIKGAKTMRRGHRRG